MKKFFAGILGVLVIAGVLVGASLRREEFFLVVATNFPAYDFARSVVGAENVKMLVPAGAEIHNFGPTPEDIKTITHAKLFVYNGGESEEWVEKILEGAKGVKKLRMMDLVETVEEEIAPGMEAHEEEENEAEIDEHVWTSPKNAEKIVLGIAESLTETSPDEGYLERAENYVQELEKIDIKIREVVKNGARKTIVVGDRFPLRYFVDEYGLEYFAAFPGCAEETEANAKTVQFLIDKVKTESIPVVFKLELSNGKIAETIADETGAKVLEFNSAHNLSRADFENGKTYVEIMYENVQTLSEALK